MLTKEANAVKANEIAVLLREWTVIPPRTGQYFQREEASVGFKMAILAKKTQLQFLQENVNDILMPFQGILSPGEVLLGTSHL